MAKKDSSDTTTSKPKSALKRAKVARSGEAAEKKNTPIAFSIDDIEALVASRKKEEPKSEVKEVAKPSATPSKKTVVEDNQPTEKRKLGAASLADILGFNPGEKKEDTKLQEEEIPEKWKKYYQLLLELRAHVKDELDLHTSDTLKHSASDESGNHVGYGNHQADAGTDEFDRDFALSLVSNEQDALYEIEEAILRIKDGSYGVCEETGEEIAKERLEAVPFTRFSLQGQAEFEKNKRRRTDRNTSGGLFEDSADAPKITTDDDDE